MSLFDCATLAVIVLYLGASACAIVGLLASSQRSGRVGAWLALAGFAFQTLSLLLGSHASFGSGLSAAAYIQLVAWFVMLASILAWKRLASHILAQFSAPLALMLFLMSLGASQPSPLPFGPGPAFYVLHMGALFTSLGFLAISGLAAVFFLVLQRRLKRRSSMKGFLNDAPPLALLDHVNAVCAYAAFPLYTLGLVMGLCYAAPVFGSTFNADPKELFGLAVWILLAALFHNRLAKGWKGRKPAWLALVIFVLAFSSFFVVNFFLPTHHAFLSA